MSNAIRIKEEQEEPELQQMAETKEEPEPEPTKEEHIELWVFQEEGQMLVMQKTNTSVATPTHEEMLNNMPGLAQVMETKEEPEPVLIKEEQVDPCRDQNEVQLDLHIKLDTDSITVTSADEQNNSSDPEPNKNQLLPANRPEPENQEDSGRGDPSLRPDKRRQDTRSNGVNVNSSELKRQKTDTASCEICGKLFRMRQHLPDNIKIHTGEKLHPCEVCGKAFKACDRLPHHLQKRRREKPFSSQTCGKGFTWNSSALHTRSHGEKPLPCEVCGKHFK